MNFRNVCLFSSFNSLIFKMIPKLSSWYPPSVKCHDVLSIITELQSRNNVSPPEVDSCDIIQTQMYGALKYPSALVPIYSHPISPGKEKGLDDHISSIQEQSNLEICSYQGQHFGYPTMFWLIL